MWQMRVLLLARQRCRHPEVLAVFGEPRRMEANASGILRDAAQARGSSG
jgi:hypothetical protein